MPISPEPPRARKRSSLPGFIRGPLVLPAAKRWGGGPAASRWRGCALAPPPPFGWSPSPRAALAGRTGLRLAAPLAPPVEQCQPLDGEVRLDRVEDLRVAVEQGGEAAGGDDLGRPADL